MNFKRIKTHLSRIIKSIDRSEKIVSYWRKRENKKPLTPAQELDSAEPIIINWPDGLEKPNVGLIQESFLRFSSWPKYKRYFEANTIPYSFYDIHKSDFIEKAKPFDIIVWTTPSSFADQYEAKSKIEFLENHLGKICLPSSKALWYYEDKIRQQWLFQFHSIPHLKSMVSFSKSEALEYINSAKYPIVSKEATNSGSRGVFLLKNKRAARIFCNQVFGPGRKIISSTYLRQKNYVIFQEYLPNEGFDLRVYVIGNNFLGIYRDVPSKDFRASGSGLIVKKDIPIEALEFAKQVKEKLPFSYYLSVDMLKSLNDGKYYVTEVSRFNRTKDSERLIVNGIPGKYVLSDDQYHFCPGNFWLQELTLNEFFIDYINNRVENFNP